MEPNDEEGAVDLPAWIPLERPLRFEPGKHATPPFARHTSATASQSLWSGVR